MLYFVAASTTGRLCSAQTVKDGDTRAVKVRLLNGKTGKPVKNDPLNIWFGSETHPIYPATNSDGEAVVKINAAQYQEIRVMASVHADCRFKGDSRLGMQMKYSLDEIVTKGVATENLCGKPRTAPSPNVLVLYVRPRTFMEKWRL